MFSFIKNFTNYGPKSFKGKSVKDILAMTSSKVPEDFFTDAYTQAHLQEFMDADLSEEQENAIDLLRDLKNKPEIIRKCYDKRKKRSQRQQGQAQQGQAPKEQVQKAQEEQIEQAEEPVQEEPVQEEPVQEEQAQEEQVQTEPAEGNVEAGDNKPLIGGGKRRTKKGKKGKQSKGKHSKAGKKTKKGKKAKKSKRVRFSV